MLSSYYVWEESGAVCWERGLTKNPRIFFILGVNVYICGGGVRLTLISLSLWEGLG